MIIQPKLLKTNALKVDSKVFLCGPGYAAGNIAIREEAKKALHEIPNVKAVYGEEIEKIYNFQKIGTDLQTLEAKFAHDVDFTLLILESPGSIAELGTFSQIPAIRGRLFVLVSERFYRGESYIARGPLSLLSHHNPNSIIYFNEKNISEMLARVRYPLTFYKHAHYTQGHEYIKNTRLPGSKEGDNYIKYITPLKRNFEVAITLISILVGDRSSFAELLLYSGLAPKQLSVALRELFIKKKIEKVASGRYQSICGYNDDILSAFNSTEISKLRSMQIAS